MIILGIDPGLASTGYGIIEVVKNDFSYITHGCVSTKSGQDLSIRILEIHSCLEKIINKYNPQYAVIEEIFFTKNVRSALTVGQVKGALLLTLQQSNIEISVFTPLEIKQGVVGYGNANKEQVQKMVQVILGLSSIPQPHHGADALAAAICGAQQIVYKKRIYN